MLFEPNLNSFSLKETLEEMIVNEKTTMKDIYALYKEYKNNENQILSSKVRFFDCEKDFFSFEIGDQKGYNFLDEPIKIKIGNANISIVCQRQVNFIKEKYDVNVIICQTDDSRNFLSVANLLTHKNHNYILVSSNNYTIFQNQNEIDKYLNKYNRKFLEQLFESPQLFEKNYEYYFNLNNKQVTTEKFYIYEDAKTYDRHKLVLNIIDWEFGSCYYFYGSSGKGKSITLIGALKYCLKSQFGGSFYINCKTLRILYKHFKVKEMRQILIDEMVFLLRNNFDAYKQCCEKIKNFIFKDEYDFWKLIEQILEYINKIENQHFILAFDQYNNENDINLMLNSIISKFLITKKFRILVFSSMNESDIRNMKIKALFEQEDYQNTMEIKNICSVFHTDFDEKETEVFNLLGKTMKVFNEILQIKNKIVRRTLDDYLEEKKQKIKFKMFCFYQDVTKKKDLFYKSDSLIDFTSCMGRILNFSPNEEYSKKEFSKIINDVPLRFFNIERRKEVYIITFAYPIIEEILIEIYKDLIFKNSYFSIKKLIEGSGALGCIFEYTVIHYIEEKSKSNNKKLFDYFEIEKILTVKKFVLNENENINNLVCKIQKLDKQYDYLIEQKVFGGKALDFILIRFINSEPYVFGFQVSIHKDTIYTIVDIEKSYSIMILLLKRYFGIIFNQKNMFFGYIFNYEYIESNKYNSMLNNCEKQSMKYCFFDSMKRKFVDKNGQEINNINNIVSKLFTTKESKPINSIDDFVYPTIKLTNNINSTIILNEDQSNTITKLVKQRYGDKKKWRIIKKTNFDGLYCSYLFYDKYFYLSYNFPVFKLQFYKPYKSYDILFTGDVIEDTLIDNKKEYYICEVF